MPVEVQALHRHFMGEVQALDLRFVHDEQTLSEIRAGMDTFAVLVFHDQGLDDDEQLAFAQRLDGKLHTKTGGRVLQKSRFGNEALADISNLDPEGELFAPEDRRRLCGLGNRLWHTDGSFVDPAGRYSMLYAHEVPPVPADTQFADMRSAYDTLSPERREMIEPLRCRHSIAHSRRTLGFEFSAEELEQLKGAVHPLVRTNPRNGRKSLYLASHAAEIIGWTLPEGRLLLQELSEHATSPERVYAHRWRQGDFVIWDNRATMHRAMPFDDTRYRREMRRVTTLDVEFETGTSQVY
jgi:alpha-ketoglutarate-dependent 2,4-dichlorophenoxyacetate dioxygenase